jgi:hypothetical protein
MKSKQPGQIIPDSLSGRVLNPGEKVNLHGRVYRVHSPPLCGRRGFVYPVEDENGRRFALKVAANCCRETLLSLRREVKKNRSYQRYGFRHADIVATGPDYMLKKWISGIRGDGWAREWSRQGFPPGAVPWIRLIALIQNCIECRIYLRDLNQNNLIWDGANWVIIDGGSVKKYLRRTRVRQLYIEEISLNWGRSTSTNSEHILRGLLESALFVREP